MRAIPIHRPAFVPRGICHRHLTTLTWVAVTWVPWPGPWVVIWGPATKSRCPQLTWLLGLRERILLQAPLNPGHPLHQRQQV